MQKYQKNTLFSFAFIQFTSLLLKLNDAPKEEKTENDHDKSEKEVSWKTDLYKNLVILLK